MTVDQRTPQILFALLRSAIRGDKIEDEVKALYSEALLPELAEVSVKHDLAHLLALGLKKNSLLSDESSAEKEIFKALWRYEQLDHELGKLCAALESAGIPYIPLKGSVIRRYYPEAWMRTSCDVDILVHEEDTEKAASVMVERCGYTLAGKGSHDVSLYSPNKQHVELHYTLIEERVSKASADVLNAVWETASVCEGYRFRYEMPDDMFNFYHIAHMAKHFEIGGCGIRPFIDLWILDNIEEAEEEKRRELLDKGSLLKFADAVRKLSRIWFENEEYDPVSKQMEDYILRGGVYGSNENRVAVQQQKQGGRMNYALSKIFLPYEVIKFHYPILQKHRWLMPFMQVRRWGKLIFCGHTKRSLRELEYNSGISSDEAAAMQMFLNDIGL